MIHTHMNFVVTSSRSPHFHTIRRVVIIRNVLAQWVPWRHKFFDVLQVNGNEFSTYTFQLFLRVFLLFERAFSQFMNFIIMHNKHFLLFCRMTLFFSHFVNVTRFLLPSFMPCHNGIFWICQLKEKKKKFTHYSILVDVLLLLGTF